MQCYNCKGMGHTAKNCPKGIICHKCKQPGHLSKDCPSSFNKNEQNNQNENEQKEMKCYNCGKSGHKSRECPNKKGKYCYICGKSGHFKVNCPNRHQKKEEEDKKEEKDMINVDESNVVNCPICFSSSNDGIKFKVGKCGHIICKTCCESLFKSHVSIQCPLCKKQVNKNDFMDIFV